MKKTIVAAVAALAVGAVAAHASGFFTNGLTVATGSRGSALIPADAGLPNSASGAGPLSFALPAAMIAANYSAMAANTATLTTSGATATTTINKYNFNATTDGNLTTAVGSTYTVTATDSVVTAASNVYCSSMRQVSDTSVGARFVVQSVVPAAGSFVITFYNNGTTAANGTWSFACSVFNN